MSPLDSPGLQSSSKRQMAPAKAKKVTLTVNKRSHAKRTTRQEKAKDTTTLGLGNQNASQGLAIVSEEPTDSSIRHADMPDSGQSMDLIATMEGRCRSSRVS